jgi:hypothetical protein
MVMRCPDCSKFVGLDTDGDPEVGLDMDGATGQVTGEIRIVNACAECGSELTEVNFNVEVDFPAAEAHMAANVNASGEPGGDHELELEDAEITRTERSEGKGRGAKTFYGAEGTLTVKCKCGFSEDQAWSDECQASYMDQLS